MARQVSARTLSSQLIGPVLLACLSFAVLLTADMVLGQADGRYVFLREMVPLVAGTLAWLASAALLARLINALVWRGLVPRRTGVALPRLVPQMTSVAIYLAALVGVTSSVFEKSVTGFLATSGAIGLVVGFAVRSLILDIFAGLAMNLDRPFRIGDWLQVNMRGMRPFIGCVQQINWRTTRLITPENSVLIFSNSDLSQAVVLNYSKPQPDSEFEIKVTLDFSIPTDRALRILSSALLSAVADGVLLGDPEPKARVSQLNENGVTYKLKYWANPKDFGPGKVRHAVTKHVVDYLVKAGVTPSRHQTDMFVAPMPERTLSFTNKQHRAAIISRIALFSGLTEAEIGQLTQHVEIRTARKGERVIEAGMPGRSMFVVVEGLLDVQSAVAAAGAPPANERLGILEPGDFFGEMSMLTGATRSATVVCATDALLYEIDKDHLAPIFEARPDVGNAIAKAVAERQYRNAHRGDGVKTMGTVASHESLTDQILAGMRHFFGKIFS